MITNSRVRTLIVVFVLTFLVFCSVDLASAAVPDCTWTSNPNTGVVGEGLTFAVHFNSMPQTLDARWVLNGPSGQQEKTTQISDLTGGTSVEFFFSEEGDYTVTLPCSIDVLRVHIEPAVGATTTKSELTGPKTGKAGDTLTYTVKPFTCDASGENCKPVALRVYIDVSGPVLKHQFPGVTYVTDGQSVASIAIPFETAGEYTLQAAHVGGGWESKILTVTIRAQSDNGSDSIPTANGGSGGGATATPTAKTNETALSLGNASGAASSPMGAFWWVIGIGAIILVAVIAAVLLLRRREDEEEYEGDVDDEYRGYEVRRR